ncbi:MAG: MATE family efflux transporter [Lachnospiraceae bacterium]|nr:MATE family efflux transporter [Lachnospiraceae bacterium]MBP3542906.1 MATE family efflux transporter [Lachnospiraceae bacterium]
MSGKVKNMTEGNPVRLIAAFAFPLMLGNIFQQLYTVVDTMVVGRVLGVQALAALGASDWLNWMILGIVSGFAQGFSIKLAQEFGAGNMGKLRKALALSIELAVIAAIVLLIISQVFLEGILTIMNTPADIIGNSILYLRILFMGIPLLMIYNMSASILRALGNGRAPLYAMIISSLVNIGLDIWFVAYLNMGIAGAAIATVIAEGCSALYCVLVVRRISYLNLKQSKEEKERDSYWKLEGRLVGRLLLLGVPIAFQSIVISVGGLVVQSVVNGFGVAFIAGFTATNKLYGVLEVAATAYGFAITTYTGQNLGAGNIKRIKEGMRAGIIVAAATSLVISLVMILFGKHIVSLFITGNPAQVQEAVTIAYHFLLVLSCPLMILYFLYIYRSALQGMGDTLIPMLSGVAEFVMRIGAVLILPGIFGAEAVFFAEVAAWAGADVILITAYYVRVNILTKKFRLHALE